MNKKIAIIVYPEFGFQEIGNLSECVKLFL